MPLSARAQNIISGNEIIEAVGSLKEFNYLCNTT
jgi:hypothetical protein